MRPGSENIPGFVYCACEQMAPANFPGLKWRQPDWLTWVRHSINILNTPRLLWPLTLAAISYMNHKLENTVLPGGWSHCLKQAEEIAKKLTICRRCHCFGFGIALQQFLRWRCCYFLVQRKIANTTITNNTSTIPIKTYTAVNTHFSTLTFFGFYTSLLQV